MFIRIREKNTVQTEKTHKETTRADRIALHLALPVPTATNRKQLKADNQTRNPQPREPKEPKPLQDNYWGGKGV
jgi:hypothetical protein